jgi:Acetokinase family/XFP N-terminal domain
MCEVGEVGYALVHAYGAAFDNPDLVVCCVVGDGEAETGPLAASWHSNKFLDPAHDGAVLPVTGTWRAVLDGRSVDTTMGFTPLDGLVMATRSGSIDPGLVLWLLERGRMSEPELAAALEHESGLLGLAGTGDMRELLARDDAAAALALDVYVHRLRGGIAATSIRSAVVDTATAIGTEPFSCERPATLWPLPRGALGLSPGVGGHRSADQLLEGGLVEPLALADVDRAARVALQADVEELLRIGQRGAPHERELDDLLVRLPRADDAVVRPHRRPGRRRLRPLPLLLDLRVGVVDEPANPGERLAPPIPQLLDLLRDAL